MEFPSLVLKRVFSLKSSYISKMWSTSASSQVFASLPRRVWKGPWRWFSESLLDCCEPLDSVKERGITFSKVGPLEFVRSICVSA